MHHPTEWPSHVLRELPFVSAGGDAAGRTPLIYAGADYLTPHPFRQPHILPAILKATRCMLLIGDDDVCADDFVVITAAEEHVCGNVDKKSMFDAAADLNLVTDIDAPCGQDDVEAACSGGSRSPPPPVVASVCKEMLLYLQAVKNNQAKQAFFHYRGAYR